MDNQFILWYNDKLLHWGAYDTEISLLNLAVFARGGTLLLGHDIRVTAEAGEEVTQAAGPHGALLAGSSDGHLGTASLASASLLGKDSCSAAPCGTPRTEVHHLGTSAWLGREERDQGHALSPGSRWPEVDSPGEVPQGRARLPSVGTKRVRGTQNSSYLQNN